MIGFGGNLQSKRGVVFNEAQVIIFVLIEAGGGAAFADNTGNLVIDLGARSLAYLEDQTVTMALKIREGDVFFRSGLILQFVLPEILIFLTCVSDIGILKPIFKVFVADLEINGLDIGEGEGAPIQIKRLMVGCSRDFAEGDDLKFFHDGALA